ncbi:hypothetical protein HHK36_027127 [Tetracentron sinense]|uniref:J domain-containing protein n=1 Tax=Tetracentron sinense TaxID=13715 RepID=A0A834YKU8_TETSI|nr:hypothetical protein HHK36_027127 [Tetracentron sinense]
MSCGLIPGSDSRFYLYTNPILPTRRSMTHLPKTSFLIENQVGSFRTKTAINDGFGFVTETPFRLLKTSFLNENRGGSFRTNAAINDGFVTAIPEMSFYELLGISQGGTSSEIKQAYKQLARKYHPDVSPPDRTEENTRRFILIQEAYETLSDPRTRALYDRDLSKGLHLAFSARKQCQFEEGPEERGKWKTHWESQLTELGRRSMDKDSRRNMSWGARMRRQRNQSSAE